jgi:glycosyltransferase involved in cell wall biosynthesis/2-polyprenyl-3-methyl-5-hydroxy-6-metoxy-1,4-benzoquinol methylase
MSENFSAIVVGKNESRTLPRLLDSLKGVDDIVFLDTGSSDDTVKIAKEYGCNVIEAGDRFCYPATEEHRKKFMDMFGFEPSFKTGEKFFHFADARNYANTFAKYDFCFQPDCDEVVTWDLQKVKETIPSEDQLVYRFCYAHDTGGKCSLEFTHCKFFRKSVIHWVGWVHEVHADMPGKKQRPRRYVDFIYHDHWQEYKESRGNYLGGLELAVTENPENERDLYYLAREYFYRRDYERSIKMFDIMIPKGKWAPEIGQAHIFKGNCYEWTGRDQKAKECYLDSLKVCDTRREPFWALANVCRKMKQNEQAVSYCHAALDVPFRAHGYLNRMELYGNRIYDELTMIYSDMGNKDMARKAWAEGLQYDCNRRYLANVLWFYECPKISIVVPTCRPEGFERLKKSIEENTVYPDYEIVEMEGEGTAIEKFNEGVSKAKGEFIVFMADDTEVTLGWLTKAFVHFKENFRDKGLVIFNDGFWEGHIANHFLCTKNLTEELDGHIWHPGYKHNNCDVELYCRLKKKDLIGYCPYAKIIHHHYFCTTPGEKKDAKDKWNEKVEEYADDDMFLLIERLKELNLTEDAQTWCNEFLEFGGYPYSGTSIDLRKRLLNMGLFPVGLKVLNVGIGEGTSGIASQLYKHHFRKLTHIEPHLPYIENDKKKLYMTKNVGYVNKPLQKIDDFSGHDVIFAFDILEHLVKEESVAAIERMKKSGARILIFIPLEEEYRENDFGVKEQDHLSFWTEDDFIKLGFKTEVLEKFHRDDKNVWNALWAWH